ncbi:MAG: GTPase Era [Trueperaceae bacterium]
MDTATPTYAGFVTIIGKPNVGKSTLLNTMLGIKVAPISPKPQTTRKGVRGIYTYEDKQLVFVDTPGLHRPKDALGDYMNREIRNAISDVEAIVWVVDLRRPPSDEDKDVARLLDGLEPGTPVYLIGNKTDVAKYPDEAINLYKDLYPKLERVYSLSALNDPEAVYALREDLFKLLPESPFFFPENIRSDQSREQWAAELIRESVMIMLREELPYTVAVQVSEWREPTKKDPLLIAADIWVEKANHRMIVLGKGGKMIKEIGQYARKQLEVFLQQKLFLELHVEVHSNWRQDTEALRELGYEN